MTVMISGGSKSGKSSHAERIAHALSQPGEELYYIATMEPRDGEDRARIRKHIQSRSGRPFQTVEQPRDLLGVLKKAPKTGTYLLDSLTALLANEMFLKEGVNADAHLKITQELLTLMDSVENLVVVSDQIYSDSGRYDSFTEEYRKALAYMDRACAAKANVVLESVAGNLVIHKGRELYEAV